MQTNFKNDVTQPVIFNTPKSLNLSELFPTYTEDKLNKVRYIIHQCNYYSNKYGYNLDLSNHRWFLSLTRNDLSYIKKVLIEASVIKQTVKGSKGNKSDHFSMVKPFDYQNEVTVNKHFFYLNTPECPLWVERYVADGSAVKNAETTAWVKGAKVESKTELVLTDDREIYIKLLEAALIANNIELSMMVSTPVKNMEVKAPELKPDLNMGVAHIKPEAHINPGGHIKPTGIQPEPKPVIDQSQSNKATQLLAGLRSKAKSPEAPDVIPAPLKAETVFNLDTQVMEGYIMVNYKKYKRATQTANILSRVRFEQKLTDLINAGYEGSETFTTENWVLNFSIDAQKGKVTLTNVQDVEIAA